MRMDHLFTRKGSFFIRITGKMTAKAIKNLKNEISRGLADPMEYINLTVRGIVPHATPAAAARMNPLLCTFCLFVRY